MQWFAQNEENPGGSFGFQPLTVGGGPRGALSYFFRVTLHVMLALLKAPEQGTLTAIGCAPFTCCPTTAIGSETQAKQKKPPHSTKHACQCRCIIPSM